MSTLIEEVRARRLPPRQVARAIRVAAGVTQGRMATELGLHRVTVARWEAGAQVPTGEARERYAHLLERLAEAAS